MIRIFDQNDDNEIDFEEFQKVLFTELPELEDEPPWICSNPQCMSASQGLTNDAEEDVCVYCGQPRQSDDDDGEAMLAPGKWDCTVCHFHNPDALFYCEVCGAEKSSH